MDSEFIHFLNSHGLQTQPRIAAEERDVEPLLDALRDVQGRFRLEVPQEYVKEERIRESGDQSSATYLITWYDAAHVEELEALDVEAVLDELAEAVLGSNADLIYSIDHRRRGRDSVQTTIKVRYSDKAKTASAIRNAQDIVPPDTYPVTLYIGEDVLGIDSPNGLDYRLTKNGEVLADGYGSAADAFGALVTVAIDSAMSLEASKGREDSLAFEQEFLLGMADYFLASETIAPEAKKHLIAFVELVTNKDLMSTIESRKS